MCHFLRGKLMNGQWIIPRQFPDERVAVVHADPNPSEERKADPSSVWLSLSVSFILLKEVKTAKAIFDEVLKGTAGGKQAFSTSSECGRLTARGLDCHSPPVASAPTRATIAGKEQPVFTVSVLSVCLQVPVMVIKVMKTTKYSLFS